MGATTRGLLHLDKNRFHCKKYLKQFLHLVKKSAGMISETLSVGLEKYQIGPKLRRLRLRKKLGLTELGRHTGLSAGMLSKIERGLLFPTLPTLLRIAIVFNTGLEHFFTNEEAGPQIAVIRKRQRLKFPNPPGGKPPAYFFESLDFPITEARSLLSTPSSRATVWCLPA